MSLSNNYPTIAPSLSLDFANTKTLDPRITFTRASTGTFYDGKTVAKAEENLFQYSQEFDNAYWSKVRITVTANTTTAPDGTTTAESLIPTAEALGHRISRNVTVSSSGDIVYSVFAKANGYNFVAINARSGGSDRQCFFNLSTGAVATNNSGGTASIVDAGNGWYRCIVVRASEGTTAVNEIAVCETDNVVSYTANGTDGIYAWGAQVEQRSSVTAYTATTTAPITNYIPALQSAASGVARFEHNPTTGESLGLEIEEQRTNLVLRSEEYDNAAWTKLNVTVTPNTIVAPDGTLTADKLVENTSNANHFVYNDTPYTLTAQAYTWSAYAKKGERNWLIINAFDTTSRITYFDLNAGVVGINAAGNTATITPVGNGWYRCTVSRTAAASALGYIELRVASADGTSSYTGDGFSGLYLWGAQIEAGAFATSYIPTVASQVTRSADAASMTGTNFSSWYRADEGTVYSEASFITANSSFNRLLWTLGFTGTSTDATFLTAPYTGTSRYRLLGFIGSTLNIDIFPATAYSNNTINKSGFAYKVNDFALSINASSPTTDTSGSMSVLIDRLFIGSSTTSNSHLNGTIKKLAYYPKRLQNEELVGLTTI
jgi:hypothetical protein